MWKPAKSSITHHRQMHSSLWRPSMPRLQGFWGWSGQSLPPEPHSKSFCSVIVSPDFIPLSPAIFLCLWHSERYVGCTIHWAFDLSLASNADFLHCPRLPILCFTCHSYSPHALGGSWMSALLGPGSWAPLFRKGVWKKYNGQVYNSLDPVDIRAERKQ